MSMFSIYRHGRMALLAGVMTAGLGSAAMAQSGVSLAGKTITATIGFEAGNRVDLYGRTLGRTMARFLPGQPNYIVMNRPGAGGVISMNEWNVKADPNGQSLAV